MKAAAKITTAADPATVNLFKAALFSDGDGASDGGLEIGDGVTAGAVAVDGEGDGALFWGTGGVATGDLAGGDDGDWATMELTNNVATSINTTE